MSDLDLSNRDGAGERVLRHHASEDDLRQWIDVGVSGVATTLWM
jgi:hypothetical protein